MNQNAPAPSFDRYTSPEAPLEQEFHTPDGSPVRLLRPQLRHIN